MVIETQLKLGSYRRVDRMFIAWEMCAALKQVCKQSLFDGRMRMNQGQSNCTQTKFATCSISWTRRNAHSALSMCVVTFQLCSHISCGWNIVSETFSMLFAIEACGAMLYCVVATLVSMLQGAEGRTHCHSLRTTHQRSSGRAQLGASIVIAARSTVQVAAYFRALDMDLNNVWKPCSCNEMSTAF